MCSYYRRFILNFSGIAEPLIQLTKKYARFSWNEECQTAFDFLKDSLTTVPLLVYPDTNKPYVLYTDASDYCIGACLTQMVEGEEKPIYFISHKLTPTQRRWSVIEKEAFAIHYALQKLDHYLHNATFVIKTDHKPLKYILDSPTQNKKIQLWALSMAGYNCSVCYIPGPTIISDLLSRRPNGKDTSDDNQSVISDPDVDDRTFEISVTNPEVRQSKHNRSTNKNNTSFAERSDKTDNPLQINAINSNDFEPKDYAISTLTDDGEIQKVEIDLPQSIDVKTEQARDPDIVQLRERLQSGKATKTEENKFIDATDGLLYYISNSDSEDPRLRLYVPKELEECVIRQYHDELGHMAVDKTHDSIRKKKYYFPKQYKRLMAYIDKCVTCQLRSSKNPHPPIQDTGIPPYPFAKIALDLAGHIPQRCLETGT